MALSLSLALLSSLASCRFNTAGTLVQDSGSTVSDLGQRDALLPPLDAPVDRGTDRGGPDGDGAALDMAPPIDAADATPPIDVSQPDLNQVDPLATFGTPKKVAGINTSANEDDPSLTGDMLELYFERDGDIFRATRTQVIDPWGAAQQVTQLSTADEESNPEVLPDGLTIYLSSFRPDVDAQGDHDIFVATRSARGQSWGTPQHVKALSSPGNDGVGPGPGLLTMIVSSDRTGTLGAQDLYLSIRASPTAAWSTPAQIPILNSTVSEWSPWITAGATVIYFASSNGQPSQDLWVSTRSSPSAQFAAPVLVKGVNTSADSESDPWLSPDLRTIYFSRYESNNWEIYTAQR
jgi:hypothetical protein